MLKTRPGAHPLSVYVSATAVLILSCKLNGDHGLPEAAVVKRFACMPEVTGVRKKPRALRPGARPGSQQT